MADPGDDRDAEHQGDQFGPLDRPTNNAERDVRPEEFDPLPEAAEARLNDTLKRIVQDDVREEVRGVVRETVEIAVQTTQLHIGPLPPPAQVVAYGRALPGLDRQIAEMALAEQNHRHEMDKATASQEFTLNLAGLAAMLVALAAMLAIVAYMVHVDQAPAGAGLGGLIIVGVIVAISNHRKSKTTAMPSTAVTKSDGD